jgi:aminoglycoside phosphotransferase (APT) family kinase protein
MLPVSKDVLDVVMLNLQRYVAPQVTTDDGRLTLFMLGYVLGCVYVEEHDLPALQAERFAGLGEVFAGLRQELNAVSDPAPSQMIGDARTAIRQAELAPADSEATDRALQLALQAAGGSSAAGRLPAWKQTFFDVETKFVEQLTDKMEYWAYGEAVRTTPDVGQRQLTAELVTDYVKQRFPEYPDIKAASVVEIPGGFSKKTYKLSIEGGPEGWDQLVIRQDAIGGPTPLSCIGEVEVLQLAEKYDLPLGNVVHVEPSDALDAPFLFMRRRPGICSVEAWKERGPDGKLPGEHLAVHVAKLHRIPLDGLPGYNPKLSPQEIIREGIIGFETRWRRDRPMADPLLEFAVQWLKENIPAGIDELSIVHADISERNVLIHEGNISALLDWELWHIGDPMYDMAYIRPIAEQSMEWSRFVEIYEAHGGFKVNMANDDFWYIFSEVRNSLMLASGLRTFVDGRNRNIKTIGPVMGQYRNRLRLAMRRLKPLL